MKIGEADASFVEHSLFDQAELFLARHNRSLGQEGKSSQHLFPAYTGITEKAALVREALTRLVRNEAARRLADEEVEGVAGGFATGRGTYRSFLSQSAFFFLLRPSFKLVSWIGCAAFGRIHLPWFLASTPNPELNHLGRGEREVIQLAEEQRRRCS